MSDSSYGKENCLRLTKSQIVQQLTQCQNDTYKVESTTNEILEKLDVLQAQVKLQHARHKEEFKRTTTDLERRLDIIEGQVAKRNEAVMGIAETLKMLSEKWDVQLQLMSNFISPPGNDEKQKLHLESVSSTTEDSATIHPSSASTAEHFGDAEFYLGKQDEQRFLRDIDLGNVPLIWNDRNVMTSEDLKVGDHSLPPNKLTQCDQALKGHTLTNTNEQNRRDHANIFSDQAKFPRVSDNVNNPENVRNIGHKNKNVTLSKQYLGDQLKSQFMRETSIATNLALSTQPLETRRGKNETALKTTELHINENDSRQFKTPSTELDNTASSDSYTMKPGSRRYFHSRKTMWLWEQRERRKKDLLRQQREKESHNLDFDVPEKTRNSDIWLDFLQHEIEQVKNKEVLGVHTVFCLDTSASMRQGMAWEQAAKFFRDFISGLEDTAVENGEIDDKIALVVFGRKTEIILRLTSDFSILREMFRKIKLGGPTQMFGGLVMALAAIAATHTPILNDIWMFPRIILLSDGKPSDPDLLDGPDVPRPDCQQQIRSKVLNVVQRIASARVIVHCVPVGDADMSLLKEIAEKTDGKIYTPSDGRYVGKRTINCKHAGNVLRHWNELRTNRYLYIPKRSLEQIMDPAGSDLGDPHVPGFIDIAMLPQEDRDHILSISKEAIKEGLWDGGDAEERIYFEFSNPIIDFPPVGCRVRRGPDWIYENDDGDGPGTIIGHSKCRKTVCVEWDKTQKRAKYRYNVRGPVDVVTVNEPRKLRFDQLIATGCLVKRGKDWKYGDQDGVPGSIGVVLTVIENGTVIVRWENKKQYSYRIGDKDYLEICPHEHSFDFLPSVDPSSSDPDFLTTEGRMLYDLSQPNQGLSLFSARNTNTRPRTKNKNSAPIKKETTKDAP
ncbi:hypothetical protein CHS0354_037956 [Potamilus streckersoni]|uniref:Uncharacterized protein n=1 Tax=Potamilus streckersoni TaxID=2493646 RepID=A0AAE0T9L0_9BIVA|nr:hypothetical protein CHS0354_037956 [Potamilus streckersoni]